MACLAGGAHQLDHGAADLLQVAVVHARADVHVQAGQLQAAVAYGLQRRQQVAVPDAVLAVLAARVGLVAVAVAEAGVDAQPHGMAGRGLGQLVQHVDGAGVHGHLVLGHAGQRGLVHHVGGEHDVAVQVVAMAGCVAGGQGAQDFAARDGVHLHALLAHQPQDVDVGAGLLRKADGVEGLELGDACADGGGVIDPQRRTVLVGQGPELGGREGIGHGVSFRGTAAHDGGWRSFSPMLVLMVSI